MGSKMCSSQIAPKENSFLFSGLMAIQNENNIASGKELEAFLTQYSAAGGYAMGARPKYAQNMSKAYYPRQPWAALQVLYCTLSLDASFEHLDFASDPKSNPREAPKWPMQCIGDDLSLSLWSGHPNQTPGHAVDLQGGGGSMPSQHSTTECRRGKIWQLFGF
jgi:hypothetical protein